MPDMLNNIGRHVIEWPQDQPSPAVTRDRSLTQNSKPVPMVWSTPNDREAELDQALRELGEDLLEQEVPERLLRVLQSARETGKKQKRQKR
jgi:hypothetical protein